MQTINCNTQKEIIIKNSKFICYLFKIKDQADVEASLTYIKEIHATATHHCYAYILENYNKSSDDGEPSGTAGIPILKVLEKNNLCNVLAVVVRYFGGIKLGAGGLIRAYTKSVTNALEESLITPLIKGYNLLIEFDYSQVKTVDYLLKDIKINQKEFADTIKYDIDIPIPFLEKIIQFHIKYEILKEINIEG